MIKLNIGSNSVTFDGWTNIDKYEMYGVDLVHDATLPLPFEDNSVDFIFSEHFIEHLNGSEVLNFLKESYRVLKTGGVIRTSTFDIDEIIDICSTDEKWENYAKNAFSGRFKDLYRIQFFNFAVYEGGVHKFMHNKEHLKILLRESGFTNFNTPEMKQSLYSELQNLETRFNSTCIVEAIK